MFFKNTSNQDVHVLMDRYVQKNSLGKPIGRPFSRWGFIRAGEVSEIMNEAVRGAQKNPALQVTDEKPTEKKARILTVAEINTLRSRLAKAEAALEANSGKSVMDKAETKVVEEVPDPEPNYEPDAVIARPRGRPKKYTN